MATTVSKVKSIVSNELENNLQDNSKRKNMIDYMNENQEKMKREMEKPQAGIEIPYQLKKQMVQVTLRIPKDVKDKLTKLSKTKNISIGKLVEYFVENARL